MLRDVGGPIDFTTPESNQPASDYTPIRTHPACAWIAGMGDSVQELRLPVTMRLRRSLVQTMQAMYPGKHSDLEYMTTHNTLVLPVVFRNTLQYEVESNTTELEAPAALFAQTLCILGCELTWNRAKHPEPPPTFLVIGFTLSLLNRTQSIRSFCQESFGNSRATDVSCSGRTNGTAF